MSTSDPITSPGSGGNITSVGLRLVPEGCVMKQVSGVVPWDNQHNLIPKQVEVIVNFLISGIYLPLCFLVSFSTNMFTMLVTGAGNSLTGAVSSHADDWSR
ncbi:hypothetical protein ACOMHN_015576 [Nucella lapillus]